MEEPTKKYFRLGPGLSVRLKSAYIIECESFDKDANGKVTTVYAKYFPNEFPNAKFVIPTQENIAIVVWENF